MATLDDINTLPEAKLACAWMIPLSTNDTVSIMLANPDHDHDISLKRGRVVANAIP